MPETTQVDAWLETPEGIEVPILGACFIGRGNMNTVVLRDNRVSARHAMVHVPVPGEYWIIDLGSRNGTQVNGRLLSQPRRLQDQDAIELPGCRLLFRHPRATPAREGTTVTADKTIQDVKHAECWLLVADIEAYTQFIQRSTPIEVASVTGNWLASCKRLIEDHGGIVNKTLGDGFLAYWLDGREVNVRVAAVLKQLQAEQSHEAPRFRVVAHHGKVFIGGGSAPGEVSLLGAEVNFVFRMEKLASSLCVRTLLSDIARTQLQPHLPTIEAYRHGLAGFEGEFVFHSF